MRVATARKELLGQRDGGDIGACRLARCIQRTGTGRQNPGAVYWLLQADRGRTGKHPLMTDLSSSSERVIRGELAEDASKVRFGPEIFRRSKTIQCEVVTFRTLKRVV